MQKIAVKIKKLMPDAKLPTYGSACAAGADLYVCSDHAVRIGPRETAVIHTGLACEIPAGYVGLICARSGLASKKGLAPANKVGVIDSDYRGELRVALHNHSKYEQNIEPGERVAQLLQPRLGAQNGQTLPARGLGIRIQFKKGEHHGKVRLQRLRLRV